VTDLTRHDGGHEVDSAAQRSAELATVEDTERYPVPDPGLEEHLPRLTDVEERAFDRATRQVATMFGLVPLLAIGFVVIYFAVPREADIFGVNAKNLGLGVTAGMALLLIGLGAVQWGRQLMDDHEMVDHRHGAASTEEDVEYVMRELEAGTDESRIRRRKVLGYSLVGALGALALPLIVSFADLGPKPTKRLRAATIETTIWKRGIRLVHDITFEPIKASELVIGQLVNAQPENLKDLEGTQQLVERAKASIIIVRMDPNSIKIPDSRRDWQIGGILCYSKICTHVGCPISLWEQQTHHLLCPCHQSTFDLGDSGLVVFGPAARALPQLPITIDAEGYLVARDGFAVPVGPSYFERDSRNDYEAGDN
jgi:ubiquinol-cytochrome c reductase iron-sulfur subunit